MSRPKHPRRWQSLFGLLRKSFVRRRPARALRLTCEPLEERVLPDSSAPPILQMFQASWNTIDRRAADIFDAGYGALWTPPPGRADSGNQSVGYDVYNRFDLGTPGSPTLYGTEAGLKALASAVHQFGGNLYIDLVWNHDGFRDQSSVDGQGHSFAKAGGYPGFVLSTSTDPNGDFHDKSATSTWDMRVAGLIDIAQDKNYQYVRSPVPGYSNNLPAGTVSAYGQLANVPDSNNTRFYPDTSLTPIVVYDPKTGEQNIHIYPFNNANPPNGTPVAENALGYLMRNAQWLVQYVGADGFRVDAAKNMPPWVLNYLDRAVYRSSFRTLLNGSQENVFSFSEVYDGSKSLLQQYVRKDINPNTPGTIGGNRDVLDFPLFFALRSNLSGNGLQNDWRNVIGASVDTNNNGSEGVSFVSSQDDTGPYLSNVAYAYTLTRPGNAIVYDNAHQFSGFPQDGRGDALGGLYGNTITTLVNIRDTHPDGNFDQRDLEKEILIYERDDSMLVALNNRLDSGYDTRTVHTKFAAGTYLTELTGNASDPTLDPNNDIPKVVQVDANGNVTLRVPRNKNARGVETDKGYVIYAPAGPQGQLRLSNVDHTVPGQTPTASTNGTARLANIPVITANSFQVEMDTSAVTLPGNHRDKNADGDNALFKIDGGVDVTGKGFVSTTPNDVACGFQQFTTTRSPGYSSSDGNGRYVQTIDTSKLSDGLHYVTVRVFRHRSAGEPPIFTDFREAIYVQHSPGFSDTDVGLPDVAGSGSYDATTGGWTVKGGGSDIWGAADQFNYDSEAAYGDLSVVARVDSVQNTDPWAKAGVMMRNDLSAVAPYAAVVVTPSNGVNFQWRAAADGQASSTQVTGLTAPVWVELVRSGNDFSAFYSTDGASWTQVGTTHTLAFSGSARAGLAVTSHNTATAATATFSHVSVLPAGWADADVGSPGKPGSAVFDSTAGTWTVRGGGSDIWGTSDKFHFAAEGLTGDGSIVAQVTAVQNTDPWAKAGVMIRDSNSADALYADIVVTPGQGVSFQWRGAAGGSASSTTVSGVTAPVWVQLVRAVNDFSGYYSTDGITWTQVGSTQTIAMSSAALAGLAVTAHNDDALNAATFTNVSLLPAGWGDADIGSPGEPGGATFDGQTWTVRGGGADIWNTSDEFNFASQSFAGDGSLVARVASVQHTDPWAKAGVMFRDSNAADAPFAAVVVTPGQGVSFEWRAAGGQAQSATQTGVSAPLWVQLVRSGNTFTASYSTDGVTWVSLGDTQTVVMVSSALAGLAVTAHNNGLLNTATFDNVSLSVPVDLSGSFNQGGILSDGAPVSGGGLDGSGDGYSANLLGTSLSAGGVSFNLGAAGGNNVVQAAGQTITLTAGQFSALTFLATAVNGAQPAQTFVVNYTDGTSDTFTQDLSDWQNPQGYAGESVAAALGYYDAADGSSPAVTNYLYRYTFTLNKRKTVSSITLPTNSDVMVLALDLLS